MKQLLHPADSGPKAEPAKPFASPAPFPFQISRKGKGWVIGSGAVGIEELDLYLQRFRGAVIDYLASGRQRPRGMTSSGAPRAYLFHSPP